MDTVEESKTYCCGCAIFPPSSALVETVVVRQNIGCSNPIKAQYYSATLVSFPPGCYYCGAIEECFIKDDSTRQLTML